MTTPPRPHLLLLAALVALAAGACDRAASRTPAKSETPAAAAPDSTTPGAAGAEPGASGAGAPAGRAARPRGARRPLDTGRIEDHLARTAWWHQDATARRVGLTPEQQGQLDAIVGRLAPHLRDGAIALREARADLSRALAAGDWAHARELAKRRGAAVAALSQTQAELVIDGLGVLTAAQRRDLASAAPELLAEPWLRPPGADDRPPHRRGAGGGAAGE